MSISISVTLPLLHKTDATPLYWWFSGMTAVAERMPTTGVVFDALHTLVLLGGVHRTQPVGVRAQDFDFEI